MNNREKRTKLIRRIVVKIGTANLCDESGQLNQKTFNSFARQIAILVARGLQVVIVSSGAIKAGKESVRRLDLFKEAGQLHKKDFAGVGARHLMNKWGRAFEIYGKEVGQVWVTFANWKHKGEKKSIRSSLINYLNSRVVIPIVNEADVISDREIILMDRGFSENDKLARMVVRLVEADAIIFLTEAGGIYNADPNCSKKARIYEEIDARTLPSLIGISSKTSKTSTGGMEPKFKHAVWCHKEGIATAIDGNSRDVILRFAAVKNVGTKIGSKTKLK